MATNSSSLTSTVGHFPQAISTNSSSDWPRPGPVLKPTQSEWSVDDVLL